MDLKKDIYKTLEQLNSKSLGNEKDIENIRSLANSFWIDIFIFCFKSKLTETEIHYFLKNKFYIIFMKTLPLLNFDLSMRSYEYCFEKQNEKNMINQVLNYICKLYNLNDFRLFIF